MARTAEQIASIVRQKRWGGGVDREHLATLLGVKSNDRQRFIQPLMYAYRRGWIDFCRQYVVATVRRVPDREEF